MAPHDVLFFGSPGELRAWLVANHATADELWIGYRPKASGLPTLTWEQVVDEILCFGWIDGIRKRIDEGSVQRITPRRAVSTWSDRNVGRVEALRAEGRMTPAGEAAIAQRRQDRTGIYSFERAWVLDEGAEAALRADPAAWAFWEAQPLTYRKAASYWIMSAKRPATRGRRLAMVAAGCAARERLGELTGKPRSEGPA
jgi:uncharacterized protein YdeI (YjbR/CyaY-like superfamily)